MKKAIVTITVGAAYERLAELTHPTIKNYADRVCADFIVWHHFEPHSHPDYQKLEIMGLFEQDGYDRVLFIDTDIIVREDAPNLFELVPENTFAAFNEFPLTRRKEAMRRYAGAESAKEWITKGEYFNAGLFVCSRQHREIFRPVFPEIRNFYAQTHLNYMVYQSKTRTLCLDHRFNRMGFMDKIHPETKHAAYMIHYAGRLFGEQESAVESLIQEIAADLEIWKTSAPNYHLPPSFKRRVIVWAHGLIRFFEPLHFGYTELYERLKRFAVKMKNKWRILSSPEN